MDSDPLRDWRRWSSAEAEGRDDDADAALQTVFRAVPVRLPNDGFADRVAETIAQSAARQARLIRVAAAVGGALALALTIVLVLQIPRLLRAAVDVSVSAVVWTALSVDRGLDLWSILAKMASTVGAVIVAPQVTFVLIALGFVALAAFYALQRVLGEERSSL